jgi:hypothetical protein
MKYLLLNKESYIHNNYSITTIRREDIFQIKQWRNDQISVLRQDKILTDDDQINYYNDIILPSVNDNYPKLILFSFLLNSDCIGYGGLTNINWTDKRAEVSFIVDTARTHDANLYESDFNTFLSLIKQVAIDGLGFNRLFTETYDIRPLHISILEKNDFQFEGRLKQHVFIKGSFVDSFIHGYVKECHK